MQLFEKELYIFFIADEKCSVSRTGAPSVEQAREARATGASLVRALVCVGGSFCARDFFHVSLLLSE